MVTAGLAAMEGGGRPSAAQAVLLTASTAITALLYSVYRQKARVARGLEVRARGATGECMGPSRAAAWSRRLSRGLCLLPAGRQEGAAGRGPAGRAAGGARALRALCGHRR